MRAIITLEELQTACTLLERACLNDQRATEGELALARPGAQDTQDAGAEPWLRYYGWLRILHKGGSTGANNGAASAPASAVEGMSGLSAAEALRAMVHAEPKRVVLELDRDSVDARYPKGMVVHVYPKSVPTLWWLCSLDAQVRRLAEGARQALALEEETDDRLLATFPLQRGLAEMVWAWILTTPGAGMPFDPNAAQADDPPAHFALLSASDLLALYLAHREIHDTRQRVAGA